MRAHPIAAAVVAWTALAVSSAAVGQPNEVSCEIPEQSRVRSVHFGEIQRAALELNQEICRVLSRRQGADLDAEQHQRFVEFGIQARAAAAAALSGLPIEDSSVPFDDFVERLGQAEWNGVQLPEFRVGLSDNAGEWLMFHFDNPERSGTIVEQKDNRACRPRFGASCDQVLDDLGVAVNAYKYGFETLTAAAAADQLARMSDQWDRFLEQGRSQTILDLAATTIFERRHFRQGYLATPPARQWTFLHPDLGYEHIRHAPPGQNGDFTVAIEWVGVNWWSEDSPLFGIPFGVSVASVYTDRPGIGSAGHGLLFHFDNKYSVGWESRQGEDGLFFSIDLLRLIDDKRERLNRYRRRIEKDYQRSVSAE